jgi:hypothetical protein
MAGGDGEHSRRLPVEALIQPLIGRIEATIHVVACRLRLILVGHRGVLQGS